MVFLPKVAHKPAAGKSHYLQRGKAAGVHALPARNFQKSSHPAIPL